MIFISAFVFFEIKAALITSILFYLAIAIPEVIYIFGDTPERAPEVTATTIVPLISNPVYIVCLWGVSLMKLHARKIHGHATTLAEVASRDALTGALNRRGVARVVKAMQEDQQHSDTPCALILFDVDHFKRINDSFGHETLIALAELTREHLRPGDSLARWGGEEFLIAAPNLGPEKAVKLADRLRNGLDLTSDGVLADVTARFGVSLLKSNGSFEDSVKEADEALYLAKNKGRNKVVFANQRTS